jgi:hypothetical protein
MRWFGRNRGANKGSVSDKGTAGDKGSVTDNGKGSVTFAVDAVSVVSDRLATQTLGDRVGTALAVGGDIERRLILTDGIHPLLGAVHVAFATHRPLVLSPDAVWLTIAQGVAQHVRLHAEKLRPRLVRHAGKKELSVVWDGPMPEDPSSWARIVGWFRDAVASQVGDGRARLFECDFSTTTDVERVASQVVLMDAYSPFFEYVMTCICGIPEITLLGTVADWRRIRERVEVIAELDLKVWARSLAPICDELVRAAEGKPDQAFWRWMYKPKDAYGGEVITGWITRLYPYVKGEGRWDVPNPMLELAFKEPHAARGEPFPMGLRTDSVFPGRSNATVTVRDKARGQSVDVVIEAGLWGVEQDERGRLAPIAAWAVRRPEARVPNLQHEIIPQIVDQHHAVKTSRNDASNRRTPPWARVPEIDDSLKEMTLFPQSRPWRLLPPEERRRIARAADTLMNRDVTVFLDLPDGTYLATLWSRRGTTYVRGQTSALEKVESASEPVSTKESLHELTVVGTSLAAILASALASDGEPRLPEIARLDEWLADEL